MSTIPVLFRHLVDDAAMFPPGELPLVEAVAAHREHRQAEYAELVGPFVCTDENLMKVAAEAGQADGPLEVSVVITGGAGGIEPAIRYGDRSAALIVKSVEVRLRDEEDLSRNALRVVRACDDCMDDETAYVEIGLEGAWERALDVVADAGYAAKLRTGGLDPILFPTSHEVAAFITACLDREVAFKCTAGLHNAIRHTDRSTGFVHHGFLNVLLATRAGLDGAPQDQLVRILDNRDGEELATSAGELSEEQAAGARRWFTSFGSCSIDEPRQDLTALGLLEAK
ncbi:hypothetical protein F1D05_28755 [Kribbella qitaiheensis]|uniref:Uncharacterized protein n=1 Tax=Kribbella qitaiheensis TaxID=1544730 RepID=A0A7G6X4K7_9ACTN|nr:hypothetical protein [Kribbella qitaiheensis]QNE21172.1 hypothetical protein F1D05_28755 [Kribbella qitaiheensis]